MAFAWSTLHDFQGLLLEAGSIQCGSCPNCPKERQRLTFRPIHPTNTSISTHDATNLGAGGFNSENV